MLAVFLSPLNSYSGRPQQLVLAGTYIGRVAVRKTGSFNIKTKTETVQGISFMYCLHTHKSDGYAYQFGELVQQKVVNFVPQTTQLNLFDTSKLPTNTKSKTKKKSKTKSSGFDGEQLSLFNSQRGK